ncbi:MAG: DAK2 domain-containing protein [Chloroflexi bacterium]|nr:MAG: DAK2 domain-containing protein [Chloroflexota bacterium]
MPPPPRLQAGAPVSRPAIASLSGAELRELFAAATAWLERNVLQVNAVNVFPVPDGDTGTNMYLTMRSTMEEAERCEDPAAGAVLAAMSHGALMGARGNSGVILSQIIGGLARGVDGATDVTPKGLAAGLEQASAAAYRAVTKPAEGTILTVIREVSEAVTAANGNGDLDSLLETAVSTAKSSVEKTPSLLPVLREAGVVDAGGLGLSVLLEGMLHHIRGEPIETAAEAAEPVEQDWLASTGARHQTEGSLYGYCTELLIGGRELDLEEIRGRVMGLGDSVIVVGDPQLVRVHVHTDDPGAALSLGTGAGQLVQVKVDNIRKQAERFVEMHEEMRGDAAEAPPLSTVAVVAGEGMARVFRSVGCTRVVSGGPTMNPSTREIVDAVEACPADDVAVLPNDKNIILAAQQARKLTKKRLHVVGTRSMPQGIAALLAVSPGEDVKTVVGAMEDACGAVRTIEITRAVRRTSIGGVRVNEGDVIAIVDDQLQLAAPSAEEAVVGALESLPQADESLATLYYGAETTAAAAEELARNIRERFSSYEVEVVFGGQPNYDYIVSVE